MVSSVADATGKMVDCEQLLLPFGTGAAVAHVLTSLQLISIAGDFIRQNIFGKISHPVDYSIMATIGAGIVSSMLTPATTRA
jgi:hypothetical protein